VVNDKNIKMRILILLVCSICLGVEGFSQNAPAEKFVKSFSERKNIWLIQKNTDSLKNMLDRRCLYVHSNGWTQNADEVVADLENGKMVYNTITITELAARQFESMVILNGKGRFTGMVQDKGFDLQLAFTEVYIKRKEGWRLVSRHSNKIDL
jgi:tRNA A-37 threonylcarbamoyl transferase component Bud32